MVQKLVQDLYLRVFDFQKAKHRLIHASGVQLPGVQRGQHIGHGVVVINPRVRQARFDQRPADGTGLHANAGVRQIVYRSDAHVCRLLCGCRRFALEDRHHRTAGIVRIGEINAFLPFLGDGQPGGGKVRFPGLDGRQDAVKQHGNHMQAVAVRFAEPGDQVNFQAHHFGAPIIHHGGVGSFRRQGQYALGGGKGGIVRHGLFAFRAVRPFLREQRKFPVLLHGREPGVDFSKQLFPGLRLGQGDAEIKAVHAFFQNGQLIVLRRHQPDHRFVAREGVDLVGFQRGGHIGIGIEIADDCVRQRFQHDFIKGGACLHADALAIQIFQAGDPAADAFCTSRSHQ